MFFGGVVLRTGTGGKNENIEEHDSQFSLGITSAVAKFLNVPSLGNIDFLIGFSS